MASQRTAPDRKSPAPAPALALTLAMAVAVALGWSGLRGAPPAPDPSPADDPPLARAAGQHAAPADDPPASKAPDAEGAQAVYRVLAGPPPDASPPGTSELIVSISTGPVDVPADPGRPDADDIELRSQAPVTLEYLRELEGKYLDDLEKSETVMDIGSAEQFIERPKPPAMPEAPEAGDDGWAELAPFAGLPKLPPDLERKLIDQSLMITSTKVVEAPEYTTGDGLWTFGRVMTELANPRETGLSPSDFVKQWLGHWQHDQHINGFVAPARKAGIEQLILDDWPRVEGTDDLDLRDSPFRLLAIGSRLDLRKNDVLGLPRIGDGSAGEARLVYCAVDKFGAPLQFTVIFEYGVNRPNFQAVQAWGKRWYDLHEMELGSEDYNRALAEITEEFILGGSNPEAPPNRSSLAQLRTNEIALVFDPAGRVRPTPRRAEQVWEIREFHVDAHNTGRLVMTTVKQNPDLSFNNPMNFGSQFLLSQFINERESSILGLAHQTPLIFPSDNTGEPFLGASSITPVNAFWDAPSINDPQARHLFSLGTCNGCHAREAFPAFSGGDPLTDPARIPDHFTHIRPRQVGYPSTLSAFLTGEAEDGSPFLLPDPAGQEDPDRPGEVLARPFHDLRDRAHDLHGLVTYGEYYEVWHLPRQRVH